jgi:hypothetical protein
MVLAPVVVVILALIIYASWFVQTERTLYYADYMTYWSYSSNFARLVMDHPFVALRALAHSVANNDVNLLPAAPISAVMVLCGSSRLVYVLTVLALYGLATAVMLLVALGRLGSVRPTWIAPLALLLLPTLWRAVFLGYLGIGGVALALAVIALVVVHPQPGSRAKEMALAGFLLALLVIFRRWYGVWALAIVIVVGLDSLWSYWRSSATGGERIRESFTGPLVLGCSAGATMLILAAPITFRRVVTEYAVRYEAYSLGSVADRWAMAVRHFGWLELVVVAGSAAVLMSSSELRRLGVLLSLQLVLSYSIMVSIQDHGAHHWYLYYPQALLLVGLAIGYLMSSLSARARTVTASLLTVTGASITLVVFCPSAAVFSEPLGRLFPADRIQPRVRDDLTEVRRLLAYLDRGLEQRPRGIYVIASSELLSDTVLGFANFSLGTDFRSPNKIFGSAHVDRQHGFPRALLMADTVVVADPVQYHLRPEDQRVVGFPAASFIEGTDVALAYRRSPETFELDGGVRALVFERVRPIASDEVEELSARLRDAYPDRPDIYSP